MPRPGRSQPVLAYLILRRLAPTPLSVPGTLAVSTAPLATLTARTGL